MPISEEKLAQIRRKQEQFRDALLDVTQLWTRKLDESNALEAGRRIGLEPVLVSEFLQYWVNMGEGDESWLEVSARIRAQTSPDNLTSGLEKTSYMNETTILFLAADPSDATRLRLGAEFREIQDSLRKAQSREFFKLARPQLSVRPSDISQALLDEKPHIVHFSGHGTTDGELCFENLMGGMQTVQADALSALFELVANEVKCVILNACYSAVQAQEIAKHISYVVGMNKDVSDKAAISFAIGFYQALGAGRSIEYAYKSGCVQIRLQGIPEHLTPVLIKNGQAYQ
jgi:CHAT domain